MDRMVGHDTERLTQDSMVGTTLTEIRAHIEALASADGDYYLVCGRTGHRPVPSEDARFENRGTARAAAQATGQYRTALRRYDPRLPYYDLIVCQDNGPSHGQREAEGDDGSGDTDESPLSNRAPVDDVHPPERRQLVEFCHRIAAAVFETLSEKGYDDVEHTVMDAYFDLAETVSDPDELCLRLLKSMAAELDDRLVPTEQAEVIAGAAARYSPVEPTAEPVVSTFRQLRTCGLLGNYTCRPTSMDLQTETQSLTVEIADYALSPLDGRLPVLPVAVELYRRSPHWPPSSLHVDDVEDGWRITLVLASDADPHGLTTAPIRSEP